MRMLYGDVGHHAHLPKVLERTEEVEEVIINLNSELREFIIYQSLCAPSPYSAKPPVQVTARVLVVESNPIRMSLIPQRLPAYNIDYYPVK